MAVSIYYKNKFWSAGNSLGYLIITTTAGHIADARLKKLLQEIDENNLGNLSLDDLNEREMILVRDTILHKTIPTIKGIASVASDEVDALLDDLADNLTET
jgi:hypothetical protein